MINTRHWLLAFKMLKNKRINRDFVKYIINRIRVVRLNPHKQIVLPYPTGIMLELGNRCNLHCVICPREYQYGKNMDQGFMPFDKVCQVVDELYPYLDSIGLTGLGETLLYPHMLEVVQYIKHKNKSIIITISTNANFVGCVDKIKPLLPYLDNVQFSVDGIGSVYEQVRPNTRFDEIADNIRRIVELGKKDTIFMINTVITRENYMDLPRVVEFADSLGIKYVNFNRINLASIPEFNRDEYTAFFHSAAYKHLLSEFTMLRKTHPGITFSEETEQGTGSFQDCTFAWHHQYITWDGYMVPCCAKPFPKEMNFGNIFTDRGVMKVLNGSRYQAWRKLWQQNKTPAFCSSCNTICL